MGGIENESPHAISFHHKIIAERYTWYHSTRKYLYFKEENLVWYSHKFLLLYLHIENNLLSTSHLCLNFVLYALQLNKLSAFIFIIYHFSAKYSQVPVWGKIESVFGHFTKFNIRKTDFSQNSLPQKQTFHKIQYQQNGLFKKLNIQA